MRRNEQAYSILLVDDEEVFRKRMALALNRRGFTVHEAGDFDNAMRVLTEYEPEMALIYLRIPGRSGLDLVAAA